MSTLQKLLTEPVSATAVEEQEGAPRFFEHAAATRAEERYSLRDEQISALAQQLFFRRDGRGARQVAFAGVDEMTSTTGLCLDLAKLLAEQGRYDVGLIDAGSEAKDLQSELELLSPEKTMTAWPIAARLWMVPRQSWMPDGLAYGMVGQELSRLQELMKEFDFAILWCGAMSWMTPSVARAGDGIVLVLSANKTRRLVAAQAREKLSKERVRLLGTVLADRKFPVPEGLYRNL